MFSAILLKLSVVALLLFTLACQPTKRKEAPRTITIDTSKFERVDSIPVSEKLALKDTMLLINVDSVKALYYPNTGKEVMTLKWGDVCNITRTGRYDVKDGRGNLWIRVERYGGKGWIFGGKTSLKSDVWVFDDEMSHRNHPFIKFNIDKINGTSFPNFFGKVGAHIKHLEYDEDDGGNRSVDAGAGEITIREINKVGPNTEEVFSIGPSKDSIQSINYYYSMGDPDKTSYNHTLVTRFDGAKVSFLANFKGELSDIIPSGKNYILIANYKLHNAKMGDVHYFNITIWSSGEKKVVGRQRLGYSGVNPQGYPLFRPWDTGEFISETSFTLNSNDNKLNLELIETYDRINNQEKVDKNVMYITRYYTFSDSTLQFDESRQEVIYRAK